MISWVVVYIVYVHLLARTTCEVLALPVRKRYQETEVVAYAPRELPRRTCSLPSVIRSLCCDGPVGQMHPRLGLLLLLDALIMQSYPRLLLLENNGESYCGIRVSHVQQSPARRGKCRKRPTLSTNSVHLLVVGFHMPDMRDLA